MEQLPYFTLVPGEVALCVQNQGGGGGMMLFLQSMKKYMLC